MEGTQSSIKNIVFFVFLILTENFVPFQNNFFKLYAEWNNLK